MAYKPSQLYGLDVGNGNTTLTRIGPKGLPEVVASFRSSYVEASQGLTKLANYSDGKNHYIVGPLAVQRGGAIRGSTDSSFYSSDRFKVLLGYALSMIDSKEDILLSVGLPLECYSSLRKEHQEFVKKTSRDNPNLPNVTSCLVIEQPRGACFNPMTKNAEGKPTTLYEGKTLIIDIGDGTLDVSEFLDGMLIDDRKIGINKGISNIHQDLMAAVGKKHRLHADTTIDNIDDAFVNHGGKFDVGQDEPIDLYKMPEYKRSTQGFLNTLRTEIDGTFGGFNMYQKIGFAGGGPEFFGVDALQQQLAIPASKVVTASSPSHSVAIGLGFFALKANQQKNKSKKQGAMNA